jgi:iron complex outermembrane recepter protein
MSPPTVRRLLALALAAALWVPSAARAHELVPPRPKSQVAPSWPGGKAEAHDVLVPIVVVVAVDGTVERVEVEATVSPAFDDAAIEAAKRWTFEPARRDGKPVPARIRSAVRFLGVSRASPAPAPQPPPAAPTPPAPPRVRPAQAASPPAGPAATGAEAAPSPQDVEVVGEAPPRTASEVTRGRDVIMAAPHRTASDALNVVPGVFVTQHSGEGKAHQIFLRGFDAVHGQDVELWVGGVPVNEVSNVHGQGYADLHFVMPEVLREIRSTPGPFDPRQGDFAVAGTIRMKLGYAEPGGTVKGTVGSFGARRLFLAYHPKDSSEETFAAFESYATDGFGPNRAASRGAFIAQATHDFSDGLSVRLLGSTYGGRYSSAGVLRASDVESGRVDRFATYDPRQGGSSSRTQLALELHKDGDGSRFAVAPFVVFRALQLRQNFTGFFLDARRANAGAVESDNTQQLNDSVTVGATTSYRKSLKLLSHRDAFEIGMYGRHDVIEQSQRRLSDVDDNPTSSVVDARVRATNVAGYADLALNPWSRLAIRPGVRVDTLAFTASDARLPSGEAVAGPQRSGQGVHVGKKLSVEYRPLARLRLLASYGDGFRSPQARSLSDGERAVFTEVTGYEVGARYGEGSRIAGSVAAFYTRLSEDLVFDPATARNERVPGSERKGLAAELTAKAGDLLLLSGSATYTHASFTGSDAQYGRGDLLPYVPQLVVRADATVKKSVARVWSRDLVARAGLGLEGLAGRPLPFSDTGRNVALFDVSAGLRLKEVELGLDVYNLVDARWYDGQFVYASRFDRAAAPSLIPVRHVTIGPPRTLMASLTLYL